MIIPRHKVCDFCQKPVGVNRRYFIIKSKNIISCFAGTMSDNRNYDICEYCMQEFKIYLQSKLKGEKE